MNQHIIWFEYKAENTKYFLNILVIYDDFSKNSLIIWLISLCLFS